MASSWRRTAFLGEEGGEDGRCGIKLLLKSLALVPVAQTLDEQQGVGNWCRGAERE
ncbi:hypothetical protein AB0I77_50605 [Streptomyces sp. NPDC050619]|uniref:hypothetical protein n=1 Tax=Streptomyces sp. NPDC050619 TaxID=3157214 RepID=UPI00343E52ED